MIWGSEAKERTPTHTHTLTLCTTVHPSLIELEHFNGNESTSSDIRFRLFNFVWIIFASTLPLKKLHINCMKQALSFTFSFQLFTSANCCIANTQTQHSVDFFANFSLVSGWTCCFRLGSARDANLLHSI